MSCAVVYISHLERHGSALCGGMLPEDDGDTRYESELVIDTEACDCVQCLRAQIRILERAE